MSRKRPEKKLPKIPRAVTSPTPLAVEVIPYESGNKLYAKSTDAEVAERIQEVFELLLLGRTRGEILRHTSKWNMNSRQIDTYMARAHVELKEVNKVSRDELSSQIKNNQWRLYGKAVRDRDHQLAAKILMDLAKIGGLDEQTVNHVVAERREVVEASDDDLTLILDDE